MWQLKKLNFAALAAGAATLQVSGSKIAVHNWTHGKQEASGRFLSPENAINAVRSKFTDYSDRNRPNGEADLVIIMITSTGYNDFISRLEGLASLLDYSEVKQALGYAKAYQGLEITKMVRPPVVQFPAFSEQTDLTPSIGRKLQAVKNALNLTPLTDDLFGAIEQLKALKAEKLKAQAEQLKQLGKIETEAWIFSERGYLDVIAENLSADLPTAENIYTFLIAFTGENLAILKELVK